MMEGICSILMHAYTSLLDIDASNYDSAFVCSIRILPLSYSVCMLPSTVIRNLVAVFACWADMLACWIISDYWLAVFCVQINKYAFSGGQDTIEKQRQYGANLEVLNLLSFEFVNVRWRMKFHCKSMTSIHLVLPCTPSVRNCQSFGSRSNMWIK